MQNTYQFKAIMFSETKDSTKFLSAEIRPLFALGDINEQLKRSLRKGKLKKKENKKGKQERKTIVTGKHYQIGRAHV